jgi:hypothetical protein
MTDNFGGGAQGGNAREQVSVPAILLMVAGGLGVAYALLSIVTNLVGGGAQQEQLNQMLSDPNIPEGAKSVVAAMTKFGILGPIIVLLANGFVFFGALKMKSLESYGLAMAASIIAIIPCCPCGCIGIPIGIWSLIVLNKPEVKSSFART